MRSPWTRAAAVALATAAVSALPLINGCKTSVEKADEKVAADLDTATVAMSELRPAAAQQAIANNKDDKAASTDAQIELHVAAAQADLQAANLIISGPGSSNASALAFRAAAEGKAQSASATQNLTPDERAGLQGIEQRQLRIAQLVSVMDSIGGQLVLNNITIQGAKSLDPIKARESLQKATSDAQKGDNGVWKPGGKPIAALDALKAREQELQKQIADLTSQRDELNTKRGQALEQAGKFGQQADATTGAQSVGFFTQGSNQRKEAADDEVKIAQLDAQIKPLQQDLNLVQGQEKTLGQIIAGYGTQLQQVDTNWQDVQRRIEQATTLSNDLLTKAEPAPATSAPSADASGGNAPAAVIPHTPHSLVALASELDAQVKEVQSLRKRAIELLNGAYTHYDQALGLANSMTKTLAAQANAPDSAKLPEKRAWQERLALNSPAGFKLRQAAVQNAFARLYSDQYAELAQRNRVAALLSDAIKQGGLTAPPALATALPPEAAPPAEVDSQVKNVEGDLKSEQPPFDKDAKALNELAAGQTSPAAQQALAGVQADLAFLWAKNLLTDVESNAGQSDIASLLVNIAHAAAMSNDYAQSQFALLRGREPEAKSAMAAALEERKALVDANAQNMLPARLPEGLAFEVKSAVSPGVPASAPAGGPGSTTGPATSADASAGTPDQQEILRITRTFTDDLVSGQVDQAMALAIPDPKIRPVFQALSDSYVTLAAYKKAVADKFGEAVANQIPSTTPDLTGAQAVINGDKAIVNLPSMPQYLGLAKADGGWKVEAPSEEMATMVQKTLVPMNATFRAAIPDIQAGKYATVDDLSKDVQAKMKAAGVNLPVPATQPASAPAGASSAEPTTQATTSPTPGTTPPPDTTNPPASAPAPGK